MFIAKILLYQLQQNIPIGNTFSSKLYVQNTLMVFQIPITVVIKLNAINAPVNSKTAHPPPPPSGQTPGHLTFWKNFGQIPRYIASLDGQMPRRLGLQRASNPPPSRHVEATVQKNFHV